MRKPISGIAALVLIALLVFGCRIGSSVSSQPTETSTAVPPPTEEPSPVSAATLNATPEDTPTELPVDTPVPAPTATPVPVDTPAPTPIPTLDLSTANLAGAYNGGQVVWVTSEDVRNTAQHLIDGMILDMGEWWTGDPLVFPQVIVIELAGDGTQVIDHVALNPWTSDFREAWIRNFDIYVSTESPELEDMGWAGSFSLAHNGSEQTFWFDPVEARYVALVINSNYGSPFGVNLGEFEVFAAPPGTIPMDPMYVTGSGNLVAASNGGYIVDYSSQDSGGKWPPENLIDGRNDTDEGWSSGILEEDGFEYLVFGFGDDQPRLVGEVVLNPYSYDYEEDWVRGFELYGSATSPELHSMYYIGGGELEQVATDQSFSIGTQKLRYIALLPVSNFGGTQFGLNEFEVYEPRPVAAAADSIAAAVPEGVEPDQPVDLLPETSPDTIFVPTDFLPRNLTEGEAVLDNIGYQVEVSDIVPVIYHLYGDYFEDLTSVTLTNNNPHPVKVWVESTIPNYTEASVDTVTLEPGESLEIEQNPPLLPEAIDLLNSQKEASLHIEINHLQEGEKRLLYEDTTSVTIYSRDDFPWGIPGYYNGTPFLATMVTPNDPAVEDLLRVAADYMDTGTISRGYGGDPEDSDWKVWDRMKAVYEAIGDTYDVTYVWTGMSYVDFESEQEGLFMQRLRMPHKVLETKSGMCVEMSLLLASAYENLGLRPIIISRPGHVYIALPASWESETYYVLEGTMVGRYSFEDAIKVGADTFTNQDLDHLLEDRLDQYYWLDVSEAREEGILPVPWR